MLVGRSDADVDVTSHHFIPGTTLSNIFSKIGAWKLLGAVFIVLSFCAVAKVFSSSTIRILETNTDARPDANSALDHIPETRSELDKMAAAGDSEAMFGIGLLYMLGTGVPKSDQIAARWFRQAAEKGHANAQLNLAQILLDETPPNYPEAFKWFSLSGEQGNIISNFNLGVMYTMGRGVKADQSAAAKYYQRAADGGHTVAKYNLGIKFLSGRGVSVNLQQAFILFEEGAKAGHAPSQKMLGYMFAQGFGTKKNSADALYWLRQAAAQNDSDAQGVLRALQQ
jgi:TPR repeat protein